MSGELENTSTQTSGVVSSNAEWPRFRLSQLLVLFTLIAVFLAISGRPVKFPNQTPWLWEYVQIGWIFVSSVLNSFAITIAGYCFYDRSQDAKFLRQPGHWLLVSIAILAVLSAIQTVGYRVFWTNGGFEIYSSTPAPAPTTSPSPTPMILFGAMSVAFLGFQIAPNIFFGRKQTERRWKWLFYFKALSPFLWVLGQFLCLVWLIRTIVRDRRDGVARDSIHRMGVALELAYHVVTIALTLSTVALMVALI